MVIVRFARVGTDLKTFVIIFTDFRRFRLDIRIFIYLRIFIRFINCINFILFMIGFNIDDRFKNMYYTFWYRFDDIHTFWVRFEDIHTL